MEKGETEKSPFDRFEHVGVVVKDMDKAIERLSALGLGPFEVATSPPITERTFRGRPTDAKVKVRFCRMGSLLLELIQHLEGECLPKEFLGSKGEGLQHVCFVVDDVDKEVARLTEQGFEVIQSGKRATGGGHAFMEVCGFIFELTQR